MHGTDDVPDSLFTALVKAGARKMNMNSWAREPQVNYWQKHMEKQGLPDLYEGGMKVSLGVREGKGGMTD